MTDEPQATLPEIPDAPAPTLPETPAVESAAPSMEDTIRETYRELTSPEAPETIRDPRGRFARAEAPPEATAELEAPAAPPAEPQPWDAPPNTWRKETAQKWAELPPEIRQEVHRRETDFHKGIEQYRDAATFGKAIFEDVAPHFQVMRQMGETPQSVLKEVMGSWRALSTGSPEQKRATLLNIANNAGISLDELYEARANAPSPAPEIAPVLQRIERIESAFTEARRAQEQAADHERLASAEKFLSDPKLEHIDAVFDDVLRLVRTGLPPQDAYDKAIWANPDTRAKLLAKQADEQRKREAAEAAAARKAAASNVRRRGTPPAAPTKGTIEDTIRSTYRQLQGG